MTPQCQNQFTPKMKANAVPRLLSSLVLIDQYNECNGMTSFTEFMFSQIKKCTYCMHPTIDFSFSEINLQTHQIDSNSIKSQYNLEFAE